MGRIGKKLKMKRLKQSLLDIMKGKLMTKKITFEKIPLLDANGIFTSTISGKYTIEELCDYLTKEWVPYVECHQCPRVDTCKFTEPHPFRGHQKKEIRCGVKKTVLNNFIAEASKQLMSGTDQDKYHILSAAFYLSEYVFQAEQNIGMMLSTSCINWLGEYAVRMFGQPTRQREQLNGLAQNLRHLPDFYYHQSILLVEGESEKVFLEQLRNSHISGFVDLRVEVYGGTGNLHPRRIQMRLDKYIEDGYICHMQGDNDGNNNDIFKKLYQQGTVRLENTFKFTYDFETSIPKNLLLSALNNLGKLTEVQLDEFEDKLSNQQSVIKDIQDSWELDITPLKLDLADEIGWMIIQRGYELFNFESDFIKKTELGNFIDFVWKMDHRPSIVE